MKIKHGYSLAMLGALAISALSGCDSSSANQPLCMVDSTDWDTITGECKQGQKVAFLPSTFGNEQLPIIFSAFYCDINHNIVMNNGGVVCVFNPVKKPVVENDTSNTSDAKDKASK
jgi:hypothetical protein